MAYCLTPPRRGHELSPDELYDNLRTWAERRGIEVLEADFGPGTEAEPFAEPGIAGLVAARADRFVAIVDRTQPADERFRTLAHELSHVLMEFGSRPPAHGVVHDVSGALEPRAYLAEALVGRAVGLTPPDRGADMAAAVQRFGLRPFTVACEIAQAAEGTPRAAARPRLRELGYF
jgi:hypothetical protein